MKKKFFTICAIVFLGFTGCTHRESANIDLTTSSVGVIETSGNSKKSRSKRFKRKRHNSI